MKLAINSSYLIPHPQQAGMAVMSNFQEIRQVTTIPTEYRVYQAIGMLCTRILAVYTYMYVCIVSPKNNLHELIDETYKARGAVYLAKKGICYWANSQGAYMNTELVVII